MHYFESRFSVKDFLTFSVMCPGLARVLILVILYSIAYFSNPEKDEINVQSHQPGVLEKGTPLTTRVNPAGLMIIPLLTAYGRGAY